MICVLRLGHLWNCTNVDSLQEQRLFHISFAGSFLQVREITSKHKYTHQKLTPVVQTYISRFDLMRDKVGNKV